MVAIDTPNVWRQPQSFEGTDHYGLRLINLTTTQRDALTGSGAAKAGSIIWNTTTSAAEYYDGSTWSGIPVSVSEAELGFIDGVTAGTGAASKALVLNSSSGITTGVTLFTATSLASTTSTSANFLTSTTVGTAGTNCVAAEHGDGFYHITRLALTSFAVGTGGDAEDLTIGALCYTFPAGAIMVLDGSVKGIFDQASHGSVSDGEVALGTVVGAGAEDTVETVGGEDIMVSQAISSVTLGTTVVTVAGLPTAPKVIASGASPRTVFLNLAATWPNIAAPEAVTFTGVVTIRWRIIS